MAGRPKAKIDWTTVDRMLKAQCTGTEVASALGIHPNTLYNTVKDTFNCDFSEYSQQKREAGKMALRQKQYDLALEGDKTLLVWLGKQYLDQKDKSEGSLDVKTSIKPIEWVKKPTPAQSN